MQKFTHARGVSGVYVIVHVESGLAYIGSSGDIYFRWSKHRGTLRRGVHSNPRMQGAWDEHGEGAFLFLIVERVAAREDLRARELWWLTEGETWEPDRGFNIARRPDAVGYRFTEEQRARLSAITSGKPKSLAQRAATSAYMLTGRTPEQKEAAREWMATLGRSGKGKRKTAAHRKKIGKAHQGSKTCLAKLSEAQVVEIMWRQANGESYTQLSREYGISKTILSGIKHGKIWRHVTIPRGDM